MPILAATMTVDVDFRSTIEPVLRAACDAAVAALAGISAAARDGKGAEVEVHVTLSDQPVVEVRVTLPQGA